MEELAAKWEDLTDIQQASVTELIAGKRQGNIVASLMTNFDVAQESLETSRGSEGSATREHEKWMESLEAKILQLKAAWQGLSQAFMKSDFLKFALDGLIKLVEGLTKMIETVGTLPTLLAGFAAFKGIFSKNGGMLDGLFNFDKQAGQFKVLGKSMGEYRKEATRTSTVQAVFGNNLNKTNPFVKQSGSLFGTLTKSISKTAIKTTALSVGTSLLQGGLIALASVAISAVIAGLDKLIETSDELSERIDKLTSDYQNEHGELVKGKGDFESMATTYAKLSKGVDGLGRNVSLTADEYAEYQSVVNSIAEQVPSLVAGYDSQGNAILNCAGNVNTLTAAYEELIKAQNKKIFDDAEDIEKDFANEVEKAGKSNAKDKLTTNSVNALEEILNNGYSADDIANNIGGEVRKIEIVKAIKDAGIEVLDEETGEVLNAGLTHESYNKYIAAAVKQNGSAIKTIINDFNSTLDAEAEGMKSLAQATLSDAFDISDSEYFNMDDTLQSVAKQVVSGFDGKFYSELSKNGESIEDYIHNMLDQLNSLGSADVEKVEAIFDLQTKFNNGDVSYGEYVSGVKEAEEVINGLALDDEIKSQIKLALNTDEIANEYETLQNRLEKITKVSGKKGKKIEEFLNGLSAEELSVAVDIIPEMDEGATLKEIQSAIDREMAIRGLVFDLNIEVEAAGIDAVNTALAETVSATGLSSESIAALKGRYAELEDNGYDLSSMFEETSNGIHLNRAAFSELEQAYAKGKLADVDADLKTLKTEYDKLTEEINSCTEASDRAALYTQRDAILQQINDCATLASQYEGLASAYNAWLSAEEAGQERDMYENIIEGFENIEDEISRGWLDDGTIKFLELLTGETDLASKSGKELKEVYEGLDDTIKNTSYSISDFFTVDDEGNSTNAGVYNFLDAIGQLEEEKFGGKDVVKRDNDGNVIGFDFELVAKKDKNGNIIKNGDQVIAEALGISEELVQIMVRASDDAGFVVNIEGAYTQLADLKSEAELAKDSLVELKEKGIEQLKGVDVEFNLEAEGDDLVKEQAKAVELLDKFRNADGTINLDMEGAQDALDIAEYLTIKIDDLTEPKYMQIDTSTVEENLQEPLEDMQEFERLSKEKHLLQLTGDTKKLEETQEKMDKIAEDLSSLDKETKIDLGIEGLTPSEIADKLEKGEIEIPANLSVDLEMSDDLKDMKLMMMNQLGLASDNEVKLKVGYDIDESAVDDLSENQQQIAVEFIAENEEEFNKLTEEEKEVVVDLVTDDDAMKALEEHQIEIEAFAKIFGVEEVDDLKEKLDTLDDEQIEILATVLGQIDVEKLKTTVNNLDDKTVEAIAKALGEGDVEGLKTTINGLDGKTVQAIAQALGYSDVDELNTAIDGMDGKTVQAIAQALGITDVDSLKGAIDRLDPKTVEAVANVSGKDDVNGLKGAIDNLKGKTVTVWASVKKKASSLWDKLTGGDFVNGTANVDGTAFVNGTSGRAFKKGDWGVKKDQTALTGELGQELVVYGNRWYTVGDNGAEFAHIPKGAIVFNHKQTEELFKNGKVTSGGGRGRALVSGTAFAEGVAFDGGSSGSGGLGKVGGKSVTIKTDSVIVSSKKDKSSDSKSSKSKSKSKDKDKDKDKEFEETFDWIEVKISRLERAIDRLDKKASRTWKSWSSRNTNLRSEITKINTEITTLGKASDKYREKANSVNLAEKWKKKVRNGTIDFSTIKDEDLAEKIKKYQEYYEKALECEDKLLDAQDNRMSKYMELFDNVVSKYDGYISRVEHRKSMLDEFINRQEADGHIVSTEYYTQLANRENTNLNNLNWKRNALIQKRDEWVAAGGVVGSEDWNEMTQEINATSLAIEEGKTALIEYANAIRDIEWEVFDLILERIQLINDEADFFIDIMSHYDLHDDNGRLTAEGMATMGLYAQQYNTHMEKAQKLLKEVETLDAQIALEPNDQDLIDRRNEKLQEYWDEYLTGYDKAEDVRSLVEEGIEIELDALQERIDKYEESLDAAKDLYDYNKKVKEQTKEIADLEKQMVAYAGDDSEEAKAKAQEIQVALNKAREELEETEYEKYISDQQELLDSLYTEYEEILNTRLDNIDQLLSDMITEVNDSSSQIAKTIEAAAKAAGYDISDEMDIIWDNKDKNKDVVSTYAEGKANSDTSTSEAVDKVSIAVKNAVKASNKEATANITQETKTNKENTTYTKPKSTTKKTTPKKTTTNKNNNKTIKKGGKIKAAGAKIYDYKGDKSGETQRYKKDPIYKVLAIDGSWIKARYHKLSKGVSGWFKKGDVKAYKTGAKFIKETMAAWTQEGGKEFIVRPSDGAILTPLAKGDSVLSASASGNIWDMANNPTDFIRNNLDLGIGSVPNNINMQNSYVQNLDKVIFNMPNVHSYNEMLMQMQKDKNFERLVLSMSIDQVAGKSKLAKGKSIR